MIIEKHYYDKNHKELEFGDILMSKTVYPFHNDHDGADDINYYGIVYWNDNDAAICIRTTVGDNERVSGCSDGNCDFITEYVENLNSGVLEEFEVVGSVKNVADVEKLLRDKDWKIEDCL